MEKTIHRLKSKSAREAFVEAELVNGISSQIRVLRQQRGWTQKELAEKLGTSQGVVSRIEDASYGRFTVKTLLDLASVFDVSILTRFVPFSVMISATWDTSIERLEAESFVSEIDSIKFSSEPLEDYQGNIFPAMQFDNFSKEYFPLMAGIDSLTASSPKKKDDAIKLKYFTVE